MRHHIRVVILEVNSKKSVSAQHTPGADTTASSGPGPFLTSLNERGIGFFFLCNIDAPLSPAVTTLPLFLPERVLRVDVSRPLSAGELTDLTGAPPFHTLTIAAHPSTVQWARRSGMKVVGLGLSADCCGETVPDYTSLDSDFLLDTGRIHRWPLEPWAISETVPLPERARYWESLFSLSNGIIGLRGAHEEDDPAWHPYTYPATFINGVYGYRPYEHPVRFPGYPDALHAMLNLVDWRIIELDVEGERFSLSCATIEGYRRYLDLQNGTLNRELVWTTSCGKKVRIASQRMVSMTNRHCAAIKYQITPLDHDLEIVLHSRVRACCASEELGEGQTRLVKAACEPSALTLELAVTTTERTIGAHICHRIHSVHPHDLTSMGTVDGNTYACSFATTVPAGQPLVLEKLAAFHTTLETQGEPVTQAAQESAARGFAAGFDGLAQHQAAFWSTYWKKGDILIEGCDRDLQTVRFSLFHLRQSNPEDPLRSIGANGLTGDKYRGHVFWDTEMYLLPHFLYTQPHSVKPLLLYRYSILDKARQRAREMDEQGALFSWNSISGEECGVVFEASTAQYHLQAAIACAIDRYARNSSDTAFLYGPGAEIIFETARFWAGRGAYVPARGNSFCINAVCGPDEYGCGVNNNCYTNCMARYHLLYAADLYDRMRDTATQELEQLSSRIRLLEAEPSRWRKAGEAMYIPFNAHLGIHEQDDSFLYLDPVDMSRIPFNTDVRETMHPLNLWRKQFLKQADVVLLMFVLGDRFSLDVKKANYRFYEPKTTHGSSLSACIHCIEAAEIGLHEEACDYFRSSALMDLNDFKNNTGGGLHSACQGGTWMSIVNGFAGFRDYARSPVLAPMLPQHWKGYRFTLVVRGTTFGVAVTREQVTLTYQSGEPLTVEVYGSAVTLSERNPVYATATGTRPDSRS